MRTKFKCKECPNKCTVKMILKDDFPNSCLFADADIKPIWRKVNETISNG